CHQPTTVCVGCKSITDTHSLSPPDYIDSFSLSLFLSLSICLIILAITGLPVVSVLTLSALDQALPFTFSRRVVVLLLLQYPDMLAGASLLANSLNHLILF